MSATVSTAPSDHRELRPLYSVRQAAAYVGVRPSTLHSWVRPVGGIALVTSRPTSRSNPSIPFVGLAEAFVLAMCRKRGMSHRAIREGVAGIKRNLPVEHALAHRMIFTSQGDIALRRGDDGFERARDGQLKIAEVARQTVQLVGFGEDGYADELVLPAFGSVEVVVSPFVGDGSARVAGHWFSVDEIYGRIAAGEKLEILEKDFALTEVQVQDIARAFSHEAEQA